MNYLILFIPLITALVGWLIHKAAAVYILKNYWPKKQQQVAKALGGWAASQFSLADAEQKLADPSVLDKAMPTIEKHIDTFLNEKLQQEIPMLGMFVGTKTTDKIKEIFINQLKQLFPAVMGQMAGNLKESFNIEKKLSEQLSRPEVQQTIHNQLEGQLKRLPLLGLISGFITGLISILTFYLVV